MDQGADCQDIAQAGIDLMALDAERWDASYRDHHITMVTAIEPGLHHGLLAHNVANMVGDILLIGLGTGSDRYLATDFGPSGSSLSALLTGGCGRRGRRARLALHRIACLQASRCGHPERRRGGSGL